MKKGSNIVQRLKIAHMALFKIKKNMVVVSCQLCQSRDVEHEDILSTETETISVYTCLSCGAKGECHEAWVK